MRARPRAHARAHSVARFAIRFYNRVAYRVYRVAAIRARSRARAHALSACVHLVYNCGAHRTHDLYKIDTIVCRLTRRELSREREKERGVARVRRVVASRHLLLEYIR